MTNRRETVKIKKRITILSGMSLLELRQFLDEHTKRIDGMGNAVEGMHKQKREILEEIARRADGQGL